MILTPKHDEFYRAMYCPEVEEERSQIEWSWMNSESRLRQVSRAAERYDEILRIEPNHGYGTPSHRICIELSDYEVGALSGGGAKRFADHIAQRIVSDVIRSSQWGGR